MTRIRWEEDYGQYPDEREWLGYLGKVVICKIDYYWTLGFYPMNEVIDYGSLKSAKRGAERMLQKFMDDAGLEVKA